MRMNRLSRVMPALFHQDIDRPHRGDGLLSASASTASASAQVARQHMRPPRPVHPPAPRAAQPALPDSATVAPRAVCSARAISAPMPPDAPVHQRRFSRQIEHAHGLLPSILPGRETEPHKIVRGPIFVIVPNGPRLGHEVGKARVAPSIASTKADAIRLGGPCCSSTAMPISRWTGIAVKRKRPPTRHCAECTPRNRKIASFATLPSSRVASPAPRIMRPMPVTSGHVIGTRTIAPAPRPSLLGGSSSNRCNRSAAAPDPPAPEIVQHLALDRGTPSHPRPSILTRANRRPPSAATTASAKGQTPNHPAGFSAAALTSSAVPTLRVATAGPPPRSMRLTMPLSALPAPISQVSVTPCAAIQATRFAPAHAAQSPAPPAARRSARGRVPPRR